MGALFSRPLYSYGVSAALLGDEQIVGAEKYLGGVLGEDGNVYAVPGKAERILKIVTATGETTMIGPRFTGHFKWLRGVQCGPKIYCIPSHHDRVLMINTTTGEIALIGDSYPGDFKWHGACTALDGCVYAIPQTADRVLRIDPSDDSTSLVGPSLGSMRNKWYGGLRDAEGTIWGIPTMAGGVLKIVPRDGTADVSTVGNFPPGKYLWHGGVTAPDGSIYGIPAHADTVLRIIPRGAPDGSDALVEIDGPIRTGRHRADGKYKYLGGAVGRDGNIYCFPSDSDFVLRINTASATVETIGESLHTQEVMQQNKWQNGFLGPDGCIYGIPLKAESIVRIVPETGAVSCIQPCGPLKGLNKWEGGVEADGVLYCMPLKARSVLKIAPPSVPDQSAQPAVRRPLAGTVHD